MARELLGCINVQQRYHDSRKMSWTKHETQEKADSELRGAMNFREQWKHMPHARRRFYYRVNVYSKGSQVND